ncbi:hypothetical protein EUGRSUZ_G02587 [Eucalyptus grandis]|uniref:Uncharacterized protein n=2 Tax=Eucalyptus grandis TaxID=71139 RepID=A0ACC3K7H2_EUCGR|nr:hypothetical protein EUGRSUZ_G02587 [Eucalyptus grandis]
MLHKEVKILEIGRTQKAPCAVEKVLGFKFGQYTRSGNICCDIYMKLRQKLECQCQFTNTDEQEADGAMQSSMVPQAKNILTKSILLSSFYQKKGSR